MNNLYKRPMFRKGGSAEGGITSGLQAPRQGYAEPDVPVRDACPGVPPGLAVGSGGGEATVLILIASPNCKQVCKT